MLTIYRPEYDDLWFMQTMMADEETMSYNRAWGGTIPFPQEEWADWYDYWMVHHDDERYYRYLKNETGNFVGEIAYHYDDASNGFLADVKIYAPYRGRGYGGQALDLLCSAAKQNGLKKLYDDMAIDNGAVSLFLKHGFIEEYRTDEIIMLVKEL